MGKRGPAPKPRALIELEGNPGKRPLNPDEPQPPALTCYQKPPSFLKSKAKRIWQTVLPYLVNIRTMTEGDLLAFSRYCDIFEEWFKLQEFVKKNKSTYEIRDGKGVLIRIAEQPQFKQYRELNRDILRMEQEFGLTPSARTRIRIILEIDPEDPINDDGGTRTDDQGFDFRDSNPALPEPDPG